MRAKNWLTTEEKTSGVGEGMGLSDMKGRGGFASPVRWRSIDLVLFPLEDWPRLK